MFLRIVKVVVSTGRILTGHLAASKPNPVQAAVRVVEVWAAADRAEEADSVAAVLPVREPAAAGNWMLLENVKDCNI